MLSKSNRPPEPDECVRALSNLSWSKTFSSKVWSTHDAAGTPEMDESETPSLIGGRGAPYRIRGGTVPSLRLLHHPAVGMSRHKLVSNRPPGEPHHYKVLRARASIVV